MKRVEIINKVRARIDELTPPNSEVVAVGLVETNPTATLIDEMVEESLLFVLENSTSLYLPQSSANIELGHGDSQTTGHIDLPSDYVRLISFKMEEWSTPVFLLTPTSPKLFNKYTTGGVCKPICSVTPRGGAYILCYYSVVASHVIDSFYYIPLIDIEALDSRLIDLFCWVCASRVLLILGYDNKAALEIVNKML